MEANTPQDLLRRARMVFFINLPLLVVVLALFIRSIGNGVLWKIICLGTALAIFLVMTILVFLQMMKLTKQVKG